MLASKRVDRPLVHYVISFILGILIGNILQQKMYVSFIVWFICILIGFIVYGLYFNKDAVLPVLFCLILGFFLFKNQSIHFESFKNDEVYTLSGQVSQVSQTDYYCWVTLSHVKDCKTGKSFKNKVRIRLPLSYDYVTLNDKIRVKAKVLEQLSPMNPSDFDYGFYLKSEKIISQLVAKELVAYKEQTSFLEKIQLILHQQLEKLLENEETSPIGIMEAYLFGDDSKINQPTKTIYQDAGVSHLLCISGFHVGIVMCFMTGVMTLMSSLYCIPYTLRQIILILAIWGYTLLTGSATSTLRATQMVTLLLIGKCLWEESDDFTSLAIAAFWILLFNPYQVFRVDFQLSFASVLGMALCHRELEKKEVIERKVYKPIQQTFLISLSIQIFTAPIIAYHFYKIPFTLSILNLIMMPLFATLIIISWILLIVSFFTFSFASLAMKGIVFSLTLIEKCLFLLEKQLPLATLCVGKPTVWMGIVYSIGVLVMGRFLWGYWQLKKLYPFLTLVGCFYLSVSIYKAIALEPNLKITSLYVGQGDCTIVEMPQHGLFIVDGGYFGQGKTIKDYIHYLGYNKIESVMVSHCDDDHVGGILELLDTSIPIKHVFLAKDNENENFKALVEKCYNEKIDVHLLEKGDAIKYGDVFIECFAPSDQTNATNTNENSLVCQLTYKEFSMLFTGDQSTKGNTYQNLQPITLLKVSHHGSKTGTSASMLSQLQPQYAMISCGIKNRYQHPHQEVLDLLDNAHVIVNRTDQEGAIFYETDGYRLKTHTELENKIGV